MRDKEKTIPIFAGNIDFYLTNINVEKLCVRHIF